MVKPLCWKSFENPADLQVSSWCGSLFQLSFSKPSPKNNSHLKDSDFSGVNICHKGSVGGIEALGRSSGTWHSKWQLRQAGFTKAPLGFIRESGECGSAAALWTHLRTATVKPLLQGKECSEGLGAVNDTSIEEIVWEKYCCRETR